jgi:predicted  nucleic acid-binding Zn-ribbon protein
MSEPGSSLREIHRLRRHAKNLQDEIERLPRQLKVQRAKAVRQEEQYKAAQDALKQLKVSTHEKEGTLKAKGAQVIKHQKQLNESAGKKEYEALQAEIAADKAAIQGLEDEILTSLAEIDDKTAALPDADKLVKKAQDEARQFEATAKGREVELRSMLAQATEELKVVEATLPAVLRPQYDRIVASKGEDALAEVKDKTCSACYTGITSQEYNDLKSGIFVICKACGRILYLIE